MNRESDRTSKKRPLIMPGLLFSAITLAAILTLTTTTPSGDGRLQSPGGYTWSLTLWYLPLIVLLGWQWLNRGQSVQSRAFWTTFLSLLVVGCALDFFFAHAFFTFHNTESTLLPAARALGGSVPSEEYLFYLGGFLFILLLYIWCDEDFLARYNVPDYESTWRQSGRNRVLEIEPMAIVACIGMIAAAAIYKRFFATGDYRGNLPGYFTYIALLGLAPAMGYFRSTRAFVNWPAFSLTLLTVTMISILWEASLAAPLAWWGYHPEQMIGIRIPAWSHLPLEATVVWLAGSFTTIIIYEAVKVWQASGGPLPQRTPKTIHDRIRRWYKL